MTATPSRSWSARAEASGSSGSRTTVSGPRAFEASTPAEAQTKPWLRLGDDERRAAPDDAPGLAEDHLDMAGVAVSCVLARVRPRARRRRADDHSSLRLGHGLLGHHEHVSGLEAARSVRCLREQPGEVVSLLDLRDPLQREDADHSRPVRRMPACAL